MSFRERRTFVGVCVEEVVAVVDAGAGNTRRGSWRKGADTCMCAGFPIRETVVSCGAGAPVESVTFLGGGVKEKPLLVTAGRAGTANRRYVTVCSICEDVIEKQENLLLPE